MKLGGWVSRKVVGCAAYRTGRRRWDWVCGVCLPLRVGVRETALTLAVFAAGWYQSFTSESGVLGEARLARGISPVADRSDW